MRPDDWQRIRALRLEALHDPMAPVAFLESIETATARPDEEWRTRASDAAAGEGYAQFLAVRHDELIGSLAVIVRRAGAPDYFERIPEVDLPTVVGVYVSPSGRGLGVIDALLAAAVDFARARGDQQLTLDVHESNLPAIKAYERAGFEHTSVFEGESGRELGMVKGVVAEGSRKAFGS
ncbi:MAG: GNAT family N-acetyltransferase [Actinomycetota bacterium]|nr:GNAT family N-acetyltransferase [Actinomycetota bacterium]